MSLKYGAGSLAVVALLAAAPAMAYVGPGAGLTLLSALWGLVIAVAAAVAFLVLWPIRRWLRRRQASLEGGGEMQSVEEPIEAAEARSNGRDADAR